MTCSKAHTRFQKQKDAYMRGDFETIKKLAKEAGESLEKKGYVKAPPVFPWIEKEWLAKALRDGAVIRNRNEYLPIGVENEAETVIGYRGRTPIKQARKAIDISKWLKFCEEYEDYKKRKEDRQFAINEEINSLIEEGKIP